MRARNGASRLWTPVGDGRCLREGLTVVFAFALVSVVATWPLVRQFGDSLPSGLGDPLLNAWILAWDANRFLHGLRGIWDAPFFHPYSNTLAYSENLFGIAIFTAPIQWLTGNPLAAYNAAFLGSFVLAGSGMFLLAKHLTDSRAAALVGGVAFAFLTYRAHAIGHLQTLMYGWMPIALYGVHRYFQTGRRAPLVVFAAASLLNGLSNGYYLYFFAFAVVVVVGVELLAHVRSKPRILADLAVTLIVMLIVISPVMIAYLDARVEHDLIRQRNEMVVFSADAQFYLDAPTATMWNGRLPGDRAGLNGLFPGFTIVSLAALGLAAAGLRARNRRWVPSFRITAAYTAVGVFGLVFSFGPVIYFDGTVFMNSGPYDLLLDIVPGMDGLRVPLRLAILAYLSLAVLSAVGVRWLFERLSRTWSVALCFVAVCGLVAEGYHPVPMVAFDTYEASRGVRVPFPTIEHRTARAVLRGRAPGAVLELPFYGQSVGHADVQTIRYMHGIFEHGRPLVNGHSGYHTPHMRRLAGELYQYQNYDIMLRELRSIGVRFILLHSDMFASSGHSRNTLNAILRQRDQVLDVHRVEATYIIELTAAGTIPAP
ncbi:MAG: hypothetical protein OXG04_10820 [Acidobacteria bacterium]|nr:hypothetical protein [Acidobacteriota bacterium]